MIDLVYEIWGINLLDWQAEDLWKFICGGVYSYSLPTDFGKSMLLEMTCALRYIPDPNRRFIMVKINQTIATEVSEEIARRLHFMATELKDRGAPLYPELEPRIAWRNGEPFGVSSGFDIVGRDLHERNVNKSFHAYPLGSRDIQGRRADTATDDVERQEEAESEAYRRQLRIRIEAVFRTMRDASDMLWLIVGTAFHGDSIYDFVTRRLDELPIPHERIVRKYRNPDGSLLWAERAAKVEIHRRLMSKTAWNAAYELEPVTGTPLSNEEIRRLVRDPSMPRIQDGKQLYHALLAWALLHVPPYMSAGEWRLKVEESLKSELAIYVSWDPATTGDWAIAAIAIWGGEIFLLEGRVHVGDTWDQALLASQLWRRFPDATVLIEKNGQQKAFKDVAKVDEALKHARIHAPQTSGNKRNPDVGIPGLMAQVRQGAVHTCWASEAWAEEEYADFEDELASYGPTSHPHVLMAVWFAWVRYRELYKGSAARRKIQEREIERQTDEVKVLTRRPRTPMLDSATRRTSRAAWNRRHRR